MVNFIQVFGLVIALSYFVLGLGVGILLASAGVKMVSNAESDVRKHASLIFLLGVFLSIFGWGYYIYYPNKLYIHADRLLKDLPFWKFEPKYPKDRGLE